MNHGVIEKMDMLPGFQAVDLSLEQRQHNYFEYRSTASDARLCYEETKSALSKGNRLQLRKLFEEKLSQDRPSRRLLLGSRPDGGAENPADMATYSAICRSFVFGGQLVRGGTLVDQERSYWEVRSVGKGDNVKTVLAGILHFRKPNGNKEESRHAWLVIPVAPDRGGNGYLWLEGNEADLERYGNDFFQVVVGEGKFRALPAIPE